MEFSFEKGSLQFVYEKAVVSLGSPISIDDYAIDYPWEYEKSGIIAEVRDYGDSQVLRFTAGDHTILYLPDSIESLTSDMTQFAGDVDILIVPGKKDLHKVIESIDARVVVPYGPSKSGLFAAFGQSLEEESKRTLKVADFDDEKTIFVNLSE